MKRTAHQIETEFSAAITLSLINSKWKLLILRCLHTRPWRFNELKSALPGISQKTLTNSLRALLENGLILRNVNSGTPLCVEYCLSEMGDSLWPVLLEMERWGLRYLQAQEPCQESVQMP